MPKCPRKSRKVSKTRCFNDNDVVIYRTPGRCPKGSRKTSKNRCFDDNDNEINHANPANLALQANPLQANPPRPSLVNTAQRARGFTNRIQEYLGTYVHGNVTPNQLATMPQNYYRLYPHLHWDMVNQNFSGDGEPLSLPEFKHELQQLYRRNHLKPRPFLTDYMFNSSTIPHGPHPLRKVRLRMDLHPMITVDTVYRWGPEIDNRGEEILRLTTVQQIDRFILPRGFIFPHGTRFENDFDVGEHRIRELGSAELEWLIHGIENPGVSPPANTRLGIMHGEDHYDTYAELAAAMGIPELQVANMEEAPFMASLLSPAAFAEFTGNV